MDVKPGNSKGMPTTSGTGERQVAGQKEGGQQLAEASGPQPPKADSKSEPPASVFSAVPGNPRGRAQAPQWGKGSYWHLAVGHLEN